MHFFQFYINHKGVIGIRIWKGFSDFKSWQTFRKLNRVNKYFLNFYQIFDIDFYWLLWIDAIGNGKSTMMVRHNFYWLLFFVLCHMWWCIHLSGKHDTNNITRDWWCVSLCYCMVYSFIWKSDTNNITQRRWCVLCVMVRQTFYQFCCSVSFKTCVFTLVLLL